MKITFLTFNCGNAGRYVNGPGMCLANFVKILERNIPDIEISIYSKLPSNDKRVKSISDLNSVRKDIESSDIIHHWSGLDKVFKALCAYAKRFRKFVIVGPNVLDGVEFEKEIKYLDRKNYDKVITVNEKLKFSLGKIHKIPKARLDILMVGPDLNIWKPSEKKNNKILWKGNSKQFVKDIKFALNIAKELKKYEFEFIGYPRPYIYEQHIEQARKAKLYFCTSLSETMSLTLCEQLACGIPAVTHPKIYFHGENYKTGIITNRTVADYCEAIEEIMENDNLYNTLSAGALKHIKKVFSDDKIISDYINIIKA